MGLVAAAYGFFCYVVFLASFLYAIGFIGDPAGRALPTQKPDAIDDGGLHLWLQRSPPPH
jgi:hypothetical protein